MLSLLGLPLTAGFMGKVLVFRPALESGRTLLLILVIVAVINTAISAYYYLRIIVVMFFKERTTDWNEPRIPASLAAVLIATVLGVFYLGIFSNGILNLFRNAPRNVSSRTAENREAVNGSQPEVLKNYVGR
jgi:NADH-quinone oxidoreductase subunit N